MWVLEFEKEETSNITRENMRERRAPVNVRECSNCVGKAEEYLLKLQWGIVQLTIIPYPTAFPYGNGMVLHFYQQQ